MKKKESKMSLRKKKINIKEKKYLGITRIFYQTILNYS